MLKQSVIIWKAAGTIYLLSAASYWLDNCYELHLILQYWIQYQAVRALFLLEMFSQFCIEYIITLFLIDDSIFDQKLSSKNWLPTLLIN